MVFDDKLKRKLGMLCFLPGIFLLSIAVYYIILISPLANGPLEPGSVMRITARNYDIMFGLLTVFAVFSAAVLIYLLVILTRLKTLNSPNKIIWVLVLATFVPLSFALFWIFVINKAPRYVPTFDNID